MKIRGVNLGNWLVLEKWMSQELFLGLEAEDESAFYEDLSSEEAKQFHPVIVGEWCIANKSEGIKELPEKPLDGGRWMRGASVTAGYSGATSCIPKAATTGISSGQSMPAGWN